MHVLRRGKYGMSIGQPNVYIGGDVKIFEEVSNPVQGALISAHAVLTWQD